MSQFIIGIDLGTTNSALAYVDLASEAGVQSFRIAQLVNPNDPCYAPYGNLTANGTQSQAALYKTTFGYFNSAPGAANAIPSLSGDPRFVQFNAQGGNFAQEWIITSRFDYNPTSNDKFFIHYKQDKGIQPTQTNLLNPIFNANSSQPSYEGQLGWTRSIGATITNQFLLGASYYRAIFANSNQAAATEKIRAVFADRSGVTFDELDGLTVSATDWWFNLRPSNTEPLLRLNAEAADEQTMATIRDEVLSIVREPTSSPNR